MRFGIACLVLALICWLVAGRDSSGNALNADVAKGDVMHSQSSGASTFLDVLDCIRAAASAASQVGQGSSQAEVDRLWQRGQEAAFALGPAAEASAGRVLLPPGMGRAALELVDAHSRELGEGVVSHVLAYHAALGGGAEVKQAIFNRDLNSDGARDFITGAALALNATGAAEDVAEVSAWINGEATRAPLTSAEGMIRRAWMYELGFELQRQPYLGIGITPTLRGQSRGSARYYQSLGRWIRGD